MEKLTVKKLYEKYTKGKEGFDFKEAENYHLFEKMYDTSEWCILQFRIGDSVLCPTDIEQYLEYSDFEAYIETYEYVRSEYASYEDVLILTHYFKAETKPITEEDFKHFENNWYKEHEE